MDTTHTAIGMGKRKKIGIGIASIVLGLGAYLGYESYTYVTTDNAMIQAPVTLLSSKVSGIIVHANVQENQKVKAGDTLVEIKPDDYLNAQAQFKSLDSKVKAAKAQLSEAKLNVDYTRVVAPADGKVGRKSFEVGMLGFVAGNERWVVANLKETDMSHITEGKKAWIHVDAIPGREFEGEIESNSPSTGATFSLCPRIMPQGISPRSFSVFQFGSSS